MCLAGTGVLVAVAGAPGAAASPRAYGPLFPDESHVTVLTTSSSGRSVESVTVHVDLACPGQAAALYAETLRVLPTMPAQPLQNDGVIVAGPLRGRKLTGRLVARWGGDTYTGDFKLTRLDKHTAKGAWNIKAEWADGSPPCSRRVGWRLDRKPGKLFVGATTDEEPVVIYKQLPRTLATSIGYAADCDAGFWGVLQDAPPLRASGGFGSGRWDDSWELWGKPSRVLSKGRLARSKAEGTVGIATRDGRCKTGPSKWTAVSG